MRETTNAMQEHKESKENVLRKIWQFFCINKKV
jgi:hypothetical protein